MFVCQILGDHKKCKHFSKTIHFWIQEAQRAICVKINLIFFLVGDKNSNHFSQIRKIKLQNVELKNKSPN